MNIVFELIPIIITVFLIFKGNKIKEYLLNLSIENKLEKKFKNVDAPMQVLFSILLLIVIFAGETYYFNEWFKYHRNYYIVGNNID